MNKAFALGRDEGVFVSSIGERLEKVTPETTGGWGFAIETCPPGFEAPLHIHHTEDGAFYILEGRLLMRVADLEVEASPGTFVFMPRAVPHTFKVVSTEPAIWVNVQGPTGDWGKYARELEQIRKASAREPDAAARATLAKKYGIEVLGPPAGAQP